MENCLLCKKDIEVLQKYCKDKNVVELRTYKGESDKIISNVCSILYTIDTFPDERNNEDVMSYRDVCTALKDYKNVIVIKSDAVLYARYFRKKIDVLFIDDGHKYIQVIQQFMVWSKHIKNNGVIIFHDYIRGVDYPNQSVREAVDYLLKAELIKEIEISGDSIVTKKT